MNKQFLVVIVVVTLFGFIAVANKLSAPTTDINRKNCSDQELFEEIVEKQLYYYTILQKETSGDPDSFQNEYAYGKLARLLDDWNFDTRLTITHFDTECIDDGAEQELFTVLQTIERVTYQTKKLFPLKKYESKKKFQLFLDQMKKSAPNFSIFDQVEGSLSPGNPTKELFSSYFNNLNQQLTVLIDH